MIFKSLAKHTMDKIEFLKKNIFQNLENLTDESEADAIGYFSESDFAIILERIEKLGIGIYRIEPRLEGELFAVKVHEDYRKKATDSKWYKKAFAQFKKQEPKLQYSASYKVSEKLLNKPNPVADKDPS